MDDAERLVILNNVMRWNVAMAHARREERTPEGHRDCARMMATAKELLAQIVELERKR